MAIERLRKKIGSISSLMLGLLFSQPAYTATVETNKHYNKASQTLTGSGLSTAIAEQLQITNEQILRYSSWCINEIENALRTIQKEENFDIAKQRELNSIEALLQILHKHIKSNLKPPLNEREMSVVFSLSTEQTVVIARLVTIIELDFLRFAHISLCSAKSDVDLSGVCESISSLLEATKHAKKLLKEID